MFLDDKFFEVLRATQGYKAHIGNDTAMDNQTCINDAMLAAMDAKSNKWMAQNCIRYRTEYKVPLFELSIRGNKWFKDCEAPLSTTTWKHWRSDAMHWIVAGWSPDYENIFGHALRDVLRDGYGREDGIYEPVYAEFSNKEWLKFVARHETRLKNLLRHTGCDKEHVTGWQFKPYLLLHAFNDAFNSRKSLKSVIDLDWAYMLGAESTPMSSTTYISAINIPNVDEIEVRFRYLGWVDRDSIYSLSLGKKVQLSVPNIIDLTQQKSPVQKKKLNFDTFAQDFNEARMDDTAWTIPERTIRPGTRPTTRLIEARETRRIGTDA